MPEYRSVKLPNELVEEIRRIITKHKEFGYMSHSEFIKDATRRRLEEIKRNVRRSDRNYKTKNYS